MRTVLDVDEKLVGLAKQQAREQGRSLDDLVADALRTALHTVSASADEPTPASEPLELGDAFFAALEEIRALGRTSCLRREVELRDIS